MTRHLLMIWTARRIPVAHHHFQRVTGIDKLWIYGHTEYELAQAVHAFLSEHDEYSHATLMPDDAIVSQQALDRVLDTAAAHPDAAVGGWSNCDFTHRYANIGTTPLLQSEPRSMSDYGHLLSIDEIAEREHPFPASFCGHTLFTMPRALWLDDATRLQPLGAAPGWGSDYSQCKRLQDAGIALYVDPLAFAGHLKLDHLVADTAGWKRLHLDDKYTVLEVIA
jgi:hypothetical protein